MDQPSEVAPCRFGFVDVTLRDGHQCLWSTRKTTAMMTPIPGALDRVSCEYVDILGGAVFEVCVRFLHENPYRRVGLLCSRLTTPCDALNDNRNVASSIRSGHDGGMQVNAMLTNTLSPVDADAYYVERARAHDVALHFIPVSELLAKGALLPATEGIDACAHPLRRRRHHAVRLAAPAAMRSVAEFVISASPVVLRAAHEPA